MKIRELIKLLSKYDPELDVIIGKDREGNGHSPCDGVQAGCYTPETTWMGEWESVDNGCREKDVNAVVLYPVN